MTNELIPNDDDLPPLSLGKPVQENPYGYPGQLQDDYGDADSNDRRYIRGPGWLAWLVVAGLTSFMVYSAYMVQRDQKQTEMTKGELLQPIFFGKVAIGLREINKRQPVDGLEDQVVAFVDMVDNGPIEQRFCHAILVNEVDGPQQALDALSGLREKTQKVQIEYNEKQNRLAEILTTIFEDGQANVPASISDDDQSYLVDEIPWYGELALNPPGSDSERRGELMKKAEFSVTLVMTGMIVGVLLFLAGLVTFFIFVAQILRGGLQHRVIDNSRYGSVYIETFAIWFLLFIGLSIAASLSGITKMGISTASLIMLLPLAALIWPILRGVPAGEMLEDVGLKPKNPLVEIAAGFVAYLAMLPLLLVGVILAAVILGLTNMIPTEGTNEFSPSGVPHPIAQEAFSGGIVDVMIMIFFIAAVLAPLTEEIMFRGVLFRNLRDSSHRMARWASVGFAAIFSSLIFAAIHPQGLVGIPLLTILAIGFCLARQWRGSLIAPMTMHALHNAAASSVMIPMLI